MHAHEEVAWHLPRSSKDGPLRATLYGRNLRAFALQQEFHRGPMPPFVHALAQEWHPSRLQLISDAASEPKGVPLEKTAQWLRPRRLSYSTSSTYRCDSGKPAHCATAGWMIFNEILVLWVTHELPMRHVSRTARADRP